MAEAEEKEARLKCEANQSSFSKRVKILVFELQREEDRKETLVDGLRGLKNAYQELLYSYVDYIIILEKDRGKNASAIAAAEILRKGTVSMMDDALRKTRGVLWNEHAKPEYEKLAAEYMEAFEKVKELSQRPESDQVRSIKDHKLEGLLYTLRTWLTEWAPSLPQEEEKRLVERLHKLQLEKSELMEEWACWQVRSVAQASEVDEEETKVSVEPNVTEGIGTDANGEVVQPELGTLQPGSPRENSGSVAGFNPVSNRSVRVSGDSVAGSNSASGRSVAPSQRPTNPLLVSTPDASANQSWGGSPRGGPKLKVAPLTLPKFSGIKRDYWRWRKSWETLQGFTDPTGCPQCKLFHLQNSLEDTVQKEINLSYCRDAQDAFRLLDSRFGNKKTIAGIIVKELGDLPPVKNNQPRQAISLIHAVESALYDLQDLDMVDVIKNQITTNTIEQKLPLTIRERWLLYEQDKVNGVTPETYFDKLLAFLKAQEEVLERLAELDPGSSSTEKPSRSGESSSKKGGKKSYTRATATEVKGSEQESCAACGDVDDHGKKLFKCTAFRKASPADRRALLKKAKACSKCLGYHETDKSCTPRFCCTKEGCKREDGPAEHHYLLCPKPPASKDATRVEKRKKPRGLTEEQEEVIRSLKLTPHQADEVKKAFTNTTASTARSGAKLQEKEYPVLMMLVEIETRGGDHLGALIDLASDTNYITHRAAKRLGLVGEPVTLIVHGVGSMVTRVDTKRYLLTIKVWTSRGTLTCHGMTCYGLDDIASVGEVVTSGRLEKFFPGVKSGELARPKRVELLISTREGSLAPQRLQRVGDLVLWDGPLGKTVSGVHPDLYENVTVTVQQSKTSFARSMRTMAVRVEELLTKDLQKVNQMEVRKTALTNKEVVDWLKWDSIGAACEPACGGCRCGQCPPGGKEMSLADERELEIIKAGLTFREKDAHSGESHWDAKYPWKEDPASLPYNRKAVEATFRRTEKRLDQDPTWKEAYARQIHKMIERGAAVKLTETMKQKWSGAVWWVSHLAAPNPHSVTTPVRIVWDSSQVFKGVSLNSILLKGPDVLNPIRAVLLRFREGEHAAIGDVKKMYNSVWLEEQEMHVHRFLWRDSPQDALEDYAVVRVNMGDKPAGCIAQVAMRETAKLPQFANLVEERKVIEENCYVDDILVSHNNPNRLNEILEGVEAILKVGGFHLKPWVRSGKSGRSPATVESKPVTLVLPNQLKEEDSKALGVGYLVGDDKLFVMASINFSKRRKKMRTECDLTEREVMEKTPNPPHPAQSSSRVI